MIRATAKALRRFRRREDGSATVEFCILFPAFIAILLCTVEAGVMMVRNVMLERGADIAIRNLRLGIPEDPTLTPADRYDLFKQTICDNTVIIPDCQELIQVQLQPVSTETFSPLGNPVNCINEATHLREIDPIDPLADTTYDGGGNNELMLVRVCALFTPFFPTTSLGMQMPRYDPDPLDGFASDKYALVVTTAFVNEPTN